MTEEIENLISKQRFDEALVQCNKAIYALRKKSENDPNQVDILAELYLTKAHIWSALDQTPEALQECNRVLKADQFSDCVLREYAFEAKGKVLLKGNRFIEAAQCYRAGMEYLENGTSPALLRGFNAALQGIRRERHQYRVTYSFESKALRQIQENVQGAMRQVVTYVNVVDVLTTSQKYIEKVTMHSRASKAMLQHQQQIADRVASSKKDGETPRQQIVLAQILNEYKTKLVVCYRHFCDTAPDVPGNAYTLFKADAWKLFVASGLIVDSFGLDRFELAFIAACTSRQEKMLGIQFDDDEDSSSSESHSDDDRVTDLSCHENIQENRKPKSTGVLNSRKPLLDQHPNEYGATLALSLPMFVELFVRIAAARYKPKSAAHSGQLPPTFSELVQFALDTHIASLSRNIQASKKKILNESALGHKQAPRRLIEGSLSSRVDAAQLKSVLIKHHATLRRAFNMAAGPEFDQESNLRRNQDTGKRARSPSGSSAARGSVIALALPVLGTAGRRALSKAAIWQDQEDETSLDAISIPAVCCLLAYVGLANDSRLSMCRVVRLAIVVTNFIGFAELDSVSFADFQEILVWCCHERTIDDHNSLADRLDGMLTAKLSNAAI